MKYTCLVCGHRSLDAPGDWDVCPICFWEDDVVLAGRDDVVSPANQGLSVARAQANFMALGACSPAHAGHVRPPRPDEPRDPSWQPTAVAINIYRAERGAPPAPGASG